MNQPERMRADCVILNGEDITDQVKELRITSGDTYELLFIGRDMCVPPPEDVVSIRWRDTENGPWHYIGRHDWERFCGLLEQAVHVEYVSDDDFRHVDVKDRNPWYDI